MEAEVVAAGEVLEEALVVQHVAGCAHRPLVVQRDVDHRLRLDVVVVGERQFRVRAEGAVGLVGDDADCTRDGIAAEQGALRSLHDLRALDVVHGGHDAAGAARPDAVHEHGDRRVAADAEVVGRDAAHRERIGEAVLGLAGEARREVHDAADVGHAAFLQHVAGEGGHGERHVLERLLSLLRRDHDFLEAHDLFLGLGCRLRRRGRLLLGEGGERAGQRGDDGRVDRRTDRIIHVYPPHTARGQCVFTQPENTPRRGFSPSGR